MPSSKYNILILGASYGSLLGAKLALAGHDVTLVCRPETAEKLNAGGIRVRLPVRGRDGLVEVASADCPGAIRAASTADVAPEDFDLIGLAMQEPQYRSPGVRELTDAVGRSGRPCMSIMNMPPLPYLKRLPGLDADKLTHCYTDPSVWESFDHEQMTLASPDPQAFRPPDEPVNVLQVSLPTNFKVAPFERDDHSAMLRQLDSDIEAIRFDPGDGSALELPVKLKANGSLFMPLAKWAMLLTGNYRCVTSGEARPIREAVHADLEASRAVYDWVNEVCMTMGADPADLVPFDKYAQAAQGLIRPSSAARELYAGTPSIERVDLLIQSIAKQYGMQNDVVDEAVRLIDERLEKNRAAVTV